MPWHKPLISAQTARPTTLLPICLQYSGQYKTACNPKQPSQGLPRSSGARIQLLTSTWMWACWAQDTAAGCAPRWPMQQEPRHSHRNRNSSSPSKTKLGQDWGAGRGQLVLFQIGMWCVMEPTHIQKAHKQKQKVPEQGERLCAALCQKTCVWLTGSSHPKAVESQQNCYKSLNNCLGWKEQRNPKEGPEGKALSLCYSNTVISNTLQESFSYKSAVTWRRT